MLLEDSVPAVHGLPGRMALGDDTRRVLGQAELQVFEGMSHAQYLFDPSAPETKEAFSEIARFFDKHLGK